MSWEIRQSLGDFWFNTVTNVPVPANAFTTINPGAAKVISNPLNKAIAPLFWVELNITSAGAIYPPNNVIAMQAHASVNGGPYVKCFNYQRGVSWALNNFGLIYGTMVTLDFLSPGTVIPAGGSITLQIRADVFTTFAFTAGICHAVGAYGV